MGKSKDGGSGIYTTIYKQCIEWGARCIACGLPLLNVQLEVEAQPNLDNLASINM
jgi:hypothetical protein